MFSIHCPAFRQAREHEIGIGPPYSPCLLVTRLVSERVKIVVIDISLRCDERHRIDGEAQSLLDILFQKAGPVSGNICPAHRVGVIGYADQQGKRVITVIEKTDENNILIKGESVGGSSARTLILNVSTGRTVVKMDGKELEL